MNLLASADGNTPISPEELVDLIPNLATKEELNEWERENILDARRWALAESTLRSCAPATEGYIRQLHQRMFGDTWKWAGSYRKTEKNIGVPVHEMRDRLGALLGDVQYWTANKTYPPDEIAIRYHHRLVAIHMFPNGNGRHARLIADVLAIKFGQRPFSWGRGDLITAGAARQTYLAAIRAADGGDIRPLLEFARS